NQFECLFQVNDCTFPQNLKGNFTYKFNTQWGSVHEKIDFKLKIQCSNFLISYSCDNDEFSNWLTSGQLTLFLFLKFDFWRPSKFYFIKILYNKRQTLKKKILKTSLFDKDLDVFSIL
ncbi:AP-3 complex subunit delta-1, partial [Brachionus plicatilis]